MVQRMSNGSWYLKSRIEASAGWYCVSGIFAGREYKEGQLMGNEQYL